MPDGPGTYQRGRSGLYPSDGWLGRDVVAATTRPALPAAPPLPALQQPSWMHAAQ